MSLHGKKGLGKKYKKWWHYDKILVHLKKFGPLYERLKRELLAWITLVMLSLLNIIWTIIIDIMYNDWSIIANINMHESMWRLCPNEIFWNLKLEKSFCVDQDGKKTLFNAYIIIIVGINVFGTSTIWIVQAKIQCPHYIKHFKISCLLDNVLQTC